MFKFTIRELLLLTLVVALAVGWWVDRRYLVSQLRPWGMMVSPPHVELYHREDMERLVEAEARVRGAENHRKVIEELVEVRAQARAWEIVENDMEKLVEARIAERSRQRRTPDPSGNPPSH